MRPLRLVEMQLTARPPQAGDDGRDTPGLDTENLPSEAVQAYEARRCHVCQDGCPPFGFGPPLTRKDQTIWACGAHRSVVDHMLGDRRPTASDALTNCNQAHAQQKMRLPSRRVESNRAAHIPTQGPE